MKSTSPFIPPEVHADCLEFVRVVEELLARRQYEVAQGIVAQVTWQQKDDWGPRKWHRTELEDIVYSSYKRMRQGRVTRPPRREVVMEIASYLNCTLNERNRLLIAAHTFPVEPYVTGAKLDAVLREAIDVANLLPMPTMIINRDWRIHYLNEHMLRLYDLSPGLVAAIPPEYLNVLHLLFDPTLPMHPNMIANQESWMRMALRTIYGFKMANQLSQYEPWYQQVVDQLMQLPEFPQCWQRVGLEEQFNAEYTSSIGVVLDTAVPGLHDSSRHVLLRPLVISISYFQFDFPQIVGLLPINAESRTVFNELGLPYPAYHSASDILSFDSSIR